MSEKNPIQSADRIFSVLELLSLKGPLGVIDISTKLDLNKSTVHRLLASLISMDYVRQDPASGKYTLTFKLLSLAEAFRSKVDVVSIAHPYLEQIMEKSSETVHLVQREGSDVVYIDKVESNASSVRMVSRIGLRQPLYCTAVGKAILATLPEEEVRKIWEESRVRKLTEHTIVDFESFLKELDLSRKRGYALDNEENEIGVRCIAVCIKDYRGAAVNAFSISAPVTRMPDERIEELASFVLQMKTEMSRALGYRS
ncbi:MAG TPA: IclR family transcriptional regulator [Clostridiaceae bacterium]|nr:IclR family transcriptional regulator [Clostridiaceae bacterium]